MWIEIFSRLPPERQKEAIEYLEFIAKKEGISVDDVAKPVVTPQKEQAKS